MSYALFSIASSLHSELPPLAEDQLLLEIQKKLGELFLASQACRSENAGTGDNH